MRVRRVSRVEASTATIAGRFRAPADAVPATLFTPLEDPRRQPHRITATVASLRFRRSAFAGATTGWARILADLHASRRCRQPAPRLCSVERSPGRTGAIAGVESARVFHGLGSPSRSIRDSVPHIESGRSPIRRGGATEVASRSGSALPARTRGRSLESGPAVRHARRRPGAADHRNPTAGSPDGRARRSGSARATEPKLVATATRGEPKPDRDRRLFSAATAAPVSRPRGLPAEAGRRREAGARRVCPEHGS